MKVIAFFSEYGTPIPTLTPIVKITDLLTNNVIISNGAMENEGSGFYSYEFNNMQDRVYSWIADSITLNQYDKYTYGMINPDTQRIPNAKFE